MQRRPMNLFFALLCVTWFMAGNATAADKTLSLFSSSGASKITGNRGDTVSVFVIIDDAATVAGASFTVTYDTASLQLTNVTSTFFGTFVSQSIPTPSNQGYVTVDSNNYYSPIVENTVNGLTGSVETGSMIAAARVNNGSGIDVSLFTLQFTLTGSAGTYPVSVIQSKISNTSAGYSSTGELIPFLVGIGDSGTYPVHTVSTINAASVVIAFVDTDNDGIDDNWELDNVPVGTDPSNALNVFTQNGDYDRDGYSDYQEYLNDGTNDPSGNPYDPTVSNTSGGSGYQAPNSFLPSVYELLLF